MLSGKLRLKGVKSTNPIAVGDRVSYIVEDDIGSITAIHERKNYIIRKSSNLSRESHILATKCRPSLFGGYSLSFPRLHLSLLIGFCFPGDI